MGKNRTFWAHVLKKSLKTVEFMRLLQFDAINFNRKILDNRSDKLIICYRIEMSQVDWMVVTVQSTERKNNHEFEIVATHNTLQFCLEINLKPNPLSFWCEFMNSGETNKSDERV